MKSPGRPGWIMKPDRPLAPEAAWPLAAVRASSQWDRYQHYLVGTEPIGEFEVWPWRFFVFPGIVDGRETDVVIRVGLSLRRPPRVFAAICDPLADLPLQLFIPFIPSFGQVWHLGAAQRSRARDALIRDLAAVAGVLAGRRHGHLREAWAADLYGDPGTSELPSRFRRLRLAGGFVVAAVRCRLDDLSELAWRPVDALLSSWHGSNLAVLLPVTIAVGLILPREGFYGLVTNAENLCVIATAPYLAVKGLRKYRQIDTPRRPEKKAESADGPER